MLQESFELPSTQVLSLYALSSYLASKPQLTVSESVTVATTAMHRVQKTISFVFGPGVRGAGAGSIAAHLRTEARQLCWPERSASGERPPGCVFGFLPPQCVCFCLVLLFLTLLFLLPHTGKVEMLKGIHAVFKGLPLFWGRGYLLQALAVMESAASADVRLSQGVVKELAAF